MSYIYIPNFVKNPDEVFKKLWNETAWERHEKVPRREYYSNDNNEPYTYGNPLYARTYFPKPLHEEVKIIRETLEERFETLLDVCFMNGYEDHRDNLGWHADDSPEMDDARPIVTVSLGAERFIMFRRNDDEANEEKVLLEHGSACVMLPGMQDTHKHRIPKHGSACGPRISLTFRGFVK